MSVFTTTGYEKMKREEFIDRLKLIGFRYMPLDHEPVLAMLCKGNADQQDARATFLVIWDHTDMPLSAGLWTVHPGAAAEPCDFSWRLYSLEYALELKQALGCECIPEDVMLSDAEVATMRGIEDVAGPPAPSNH